MQPLESLPSDGRGGGRGPARSLDELIQGTLRLLHSHDRPEQAQSLWDGLRAGLAVGPQVVVVGEVGRGKSSLINALLGRPGLSPVGGDVTTAAFLRFLPPYDALPVGLASLVYEGARRRVIPYEDLADWVTASGSHRLNADGMPPRGAEVAAEAVHLPGVVLVDTPGSGGLDGGHALLAVAMASEASLLVFVADAGRRLTQGELEYLGRCTERVHAIVVVLAKTDTHPRGWREVLAEDVELLRVHAPDLNVVAVLGASSRLAEDGLRCADGDLAARLLQASGIPALAEAMRVQLGAYPQLLRANALRQAQGMLEQLLIEKQRIRLGMAGEQSAVSSLREEQTQLAELQARRERWSLDLDRDLGRLQRDISELLASRLRELQQRWSADITGRLWMPRAPRAQELACEISSELEALLREVDVEFRERLHGVIAALHQDVDQPAPLPSVLPVTTLHRPVPLPTPASARAWAALLPAGIAGGAAGATRLAAGSGVAAAGLATAGLAVLPFVITPLVVGGVKSVMDAGRQEMLTWLRQEVDAVRLSAINAVANSVGELKPELVAHFRKHIRSRIDELNASIQQIKAATAADRGTRESLVARADRDIGAISGQLQEVRSALADLSRTPGTSSGSASSKHR